ncbi:I78 family peptidase inhibitor [Comamonas granuli]|uniref:I78 family peptidase inhibitor n=1 Tax=Comamonas granuli TaxID=290309 RepID=UPI000AE0CE6E|nr:I78 family peptidase inhibitor [Comamonas granuli]
MSPAAIRPLAALLAALLAGCAAPPPATGPTGAPRGGLCQAPPAQAFVGQNSTAKVVEAARVRSGALLVRILRPGQAVTKEFDAQRLNLEVDASGRIVAARCG